MPSSAKKRVPPRHGYRRIGARRAFLRGFSRAFDLFGRLREPLPYETGEPTDGAALMSDWQDVGADFKDVAEQLQR